MERQVSEQFTVIDQKNLIDINESKRSEYQQRSVQHHSNTNKSSQQMSISISVQNQSIRDKVNRTTLAKDGQSQPKEIYSNDVPLGQQQADVDADKIANSVDQQTLSISAGQNKSSNEQAIALISQSNGPVGSNNGASTENLNQTPAMQLQHQYSQHETAGPDNNLDAGADDKMFEVDMDGSVDDARSQLVVSKNPVNAPVRPVSQHHNMRTNSRANKQKNGGVVVRKKRVKSTRPGGIRGGVLVQDKYSTNTPASTKKIRTNKFGGIGDSSSANMMLGQSTNAGSVNQQSSKLYMSYAPTGLVKVGNMSLQRLRPRITSSYNTTNNQQHFRPTTAGVRSLIPGHQQDQLASEYASFSHLNTSSQGGYPGRLNRPQTQFSRQQLNKFASMKAQMLRHEDGANSGNFSMNSGQAIRQMHQQQVDMMPNSMQMQTEPLSADAQSQDLNQAASDLQDGFKLVSQFESEQAAIAYATELQKYYDGLNMDVKVQIEANLTQLDDTENKQYLQEAMAAYQQERGQISLEDSQHSHPTMSDEQKHHAKLNIKTAFSNHFTKIEQVQLRQIKGVMRRDADLTEPKFAKRVNMIKPTKAEAVQYDKPSRQQIKEVLQAQDQIFGVIKSSAKLPALSYQNAGAQERNQVVPGFKFDQDIRKTQIKHNATLQAKILQKLGVLPNELQGEVQHASQVMSNDNKIPKSMAKFYQREQRLKKLFDAQVSQWQKDAPLLETTQQSLTSLVDSGQPQEPKFDVDVRLYKERGDDYCIIGNKLQYRASEEANEGLNYSHKQALETKESFDPIRICLRIMPISRAPLAQGKTPDYYFREAAKKSLSGDLTSAIEQLKRGLLINPNHYICRFNHGVLMFKFGLIREACRDFEMLTGHAHGRKDPWVFYNYATCLIQLGMPEKPIYQQDKERELRRQSTRMQISQAQRKISVASQAHHAFTQFSSEISNFGHTVEQMTQKYDKGSENYLTAIKMCSRAYSLGAKDGKDKEIMLDALKLKGVCLYRLGELIEAVKVLYKARMLQAKIDEEIEARRRAREHRVVDEVIGYFTAMDYRNFNKKRSKSFNFTRHTKMRLSKTTMQRQKRDLSWSGHEMEQVRLEHEAHIQNMLTDQSSSSCSQEDQRPTSGEKSNSTDHSKALSNASRRMVEETKKAILEKETDFEGTSNQLLAPGVQSSKVLSDTERVSAYGGSKNESQDISEKWSRRGKESKREIEGVSSSGQLRLPTPEKNLRFNLPPDQKKAVVHKTMTRMLVDRLSKVRNKIIRETKRTMNPDRIEELMKKLLRQKEELALDRKQLKMSKQEYAIFRKTYLELRKQSDSKVDEEQPMLRLKNMVLREFDEYEEEYEDCNVLEVIELRKRKNILKWINEDDLIMQLIKSAAQNLQKMGEVGEDPVEARLNTKFVKKLLKVAKVQFEEVDGTHLETLLDIIGDQSQMDGIMGDLRFKVTEMCRQFEKEINRGNEELTAIEPKLDEMKILRGERHIDVEDQNLGNEDKMITRLRDALKNDSTTPDEVINVLTTDNFEKEKLKLQLQYMNGASDDELEDGGKLFIHRNQIAGKSKRNMDVKQDMRYTERHIEMIKNQFMQNKNERNYKVLEKLMRHLRFIKRHEPDVRKQIYKHAEFIEIDAKQVVFSKGDDADFMYIILKGRVSCESTHPLYKDIPSFVAAVKDGEAFGELAVVDHEQIQQESMASKMGVDTQHEFIHPKRSATCRTVEKSRMIRIGALHAKQIVQPTMRKEQEQSTITIAPPSRDLSNTASVESQSASVDGIVPFAEVRDYSKDELNKKLAFLKGFEMFRDIKNEKILIPVALSMDTVQFKYGEFLTRAGDRPAGMFLIKSGQCVVGLTQQSTRAKNYRDIPGQREPIVDKNPLFHRFDPENSLLNNVEMQDRVFQNGRIYVQNNDQIRDKIMYHDFLQFSKLFPNNQFGGRCLIPFDIYLQLKRSYFGPSALARPDNEPIGDIKKQENYHMKSFLDVVANSACVEAYLINKQGIEYLSGQNLKNIYECIVQEKEPDRPFLEEKINHKRDEMLRSQAKSLKTVQRIMLQNKIQKYGVMAVKEAQ